MRPQFLDVISLFHEADVIHQQSNDSLIFSCNQLKMEFMIIRFECLFVFKVLLKQRESLRILEKSLQSLDYCPCFVVVFVCYTFAVARFLLLVSRMISWMGFLLNIFRLGISFRVIS